MQLVDLTGLENVKAVSIVSITYNDRLASLQGLAGLIAVDFVGLAQNPLLQDLTGLEGVKTLGYGLDVYDNDGLRSLHGLENLTGVPDFRLRENSRLMSLAALSSFMQLTSFDAENNPLLPACEVSALFARANGMLLYNTGNNQAAICP